MGGAFGCSSNGVVEFQSLIGRVEVHPAVRIFGEKFQDQRTQRLDEVQRIPREVDLAGVQAWALHQIFSKRINFGRRRRLVLVFIQPQGDVIRMSIEILRSVQQATKRHASTHIARAQQCCKDITSLLIDVLIARINGIVVVVDLVVPKLILKRVLPDIGSDDQFEGALTEVWGKRRAGHFDMVFTYHGKIIPNVGNLYASLMEMVIMPV